MAVAEDNDVQASDGPWPPQPGDDAVGPFAPHADPGVRGAGANGASDANGAGDVGSAAEVEARRRARSRRRCSPRGGRRRRATCTHSRDARVTPWRGRSPRPRAIADCRACSRETACARVACRPTFVVCTRASPAKLATHDPPFHPVFLLAVFLAAAFWHFALRKAAHAAQERKKVGIPKRCSAASLVLQYDHQTRCRELAKGDERWSMRAGVRARSTECTWRGGITPTLDAIGRQAATLFGAMASDGDAALGLSAIVGTDSTLIAFISSTGFADYMLLHLMPLCMCYLLHGALVFRTPPILPRVDRLFISNSHHFTRKIITLHVLATLIQCIQIQALSVQWVYFLMSLRSVRIVSCFLVS